MIFAEVTLSTEAIVVVGALMGALAGALAKIFKMLMEAKDDQLKALRSEAASYKEIGEEAVSNIEKHVNEKRAKEGQPPFPIVAPVVPEHSSPTTAKQQRDADLQTMRARLVAATLALGLEARQPSQSE